MAEINLGIDLGTRIGDGTLYAGISPDDGAPLFLMPRDTGDLVTKEEAECVARNLNACGHNDWQRPTIAEAKKICQLTRDYPRLAETFRFTAEWRPTSYPDSFYWTRSIRPASTAREHIWAMDFGRNQAVSFDDDSIAKVRCVRRFSLRGM